MLPTKNLPPLQEKVSLFRLRADSCRKGDFAPPDFWNVRFAAAIILFLSPFIASGEAASKDEGPGQARKIEGALLIGQVESLLSDPGTTRLDSHQVSEHLSKVDLEEFCAVHPSARGDEVRPIWNERGVYALRYVNVEKEGIPYRLGIRSGMKLLRTTGSESSWATWNGKGMPGICSGSAFRLIVLQDYRLFELEGSFRGAGEDASVQSPDLEVHIDYRRIQAPSDTRYLEIVAVPWAQTLSLQDHTDLCSASVSGSMSVAPVVLEKRLGLRLVQVPRPGHFYNLGFRSGDVLYAVQGTANARLEELFGGLCLEGESSLILERGGILLEVTLTSESTKSPSGPAVTLRATFHPGADVELPLFSPASPENPINPSTGRPFTDRQMMQFDRLRERFPGNSVIPVRQNDELARRREERQKRIYVIQERILQKEATCQEVNEYYDFQEKSTRDRLELMEYALSRDAASEETKANLQEHFHRMRRTLESYKQARLRALKHCLLPE